MNMGFGATRHIHDLAAAIRRQDFAAADDALSMFVRERADYAEVVANGRATIHARPPRQKLRRAA